MTILCGSFDTHTWIISCLLLGFCVEAQVGGSPIPLFPGQFTILFISLQNIAFQNRISCV